jgi:hypothetical protein
VLRLFFLAGSCFKPAPTICFTDHHHWSLITD